MARQRNNSYLYSIAVDTPNGECIVINDIKNLQSVATTINDRFFNSFDVVSRAMVNNWLYQPDTPRRQFATNFDISRVCA